jgi:hypothetical protein
MAGHFLETIHALQFHVFLILSLNPGIEWMSPAIIISTNDVEFLHLIS